MMTREFPPFRPHPLLTGGHRQTLAGIFLPGRRYTYEARQHQVRLADGDRLVLHEDCPRSWQPGDRTALLVHGLAGCHSSPYMVRVAAKLCQRGVRVFRMDLRGCGAGWGLALLPYHSGRSEDAAAALEYMSRLCPDSPATLVGFSLGGNIALKLLGECEDRPPGNLASAVAVCPPIHLAYAIQQLRRLENRLYERRFVQLLYRRANDLAGISPLARGRFRRPPRTLLEFDEQFTAPVCGFGTAENYYAQASAIRTIARIRLPTLVIASRDDPMVPHEPWLDVETPPSFVLCLTDHGGHLGFIGVSTGDPDLRWMDWRVVEWTTGRVVPATA